MLMVLHSKLFSVSRRDLDADTGLSSEIIWLLQAKKNLRTV